MSFKEYNQDQPFLLPPSIHDFLPDGRLSHVINEVVNELDLKELYNRYSDLGCSAYHPQMPLKTFFYGYTMGERSSRLMEKGMEKGKKKGKKREKGDEGEKDEKGDRFIFLFTFLFFSAFPVHETQSASQSSYQLLQ